MAASTTSSENLNNNNSSEKKNVPKSRFQATVCLEDWWLVKAENDLQGTRLGVAGHNTTGGKQTRRFFTCLPILKSHDAFTLETTDGKCVIIQGRINEARSAENGFPSDVCDHFTLGFPPYWKEYAEKLMVKGSPYDPSRVGSCDNDLGSQDTEDAENIQPNKETKSSAVLLPQESKTIIINSEKTPERSCSSSGGQEIYGGWIVEEDRAIQDMPVNCLKSAVKSLTSSCSGEKLNSPDSTIKDVDDSQTHEIEGSLSACHLHTPSRSSRCADGSMRKVKLGQKGSSKSNFSPEKNSLDVILAKSTGRVETRSLSRLKKRQKNDKTSAVISGGLATDKMSESAIAVGSAKGKFKKITQTPNREKDLRHVETEVKMQKKNKAESPLSSPAAPDGEKQAGGADSHTLSEHVKAQKMNATRQLLYETHERRKEYISDLGSQDTKEAENIQPNKETKSSAVPVLQESEAVIINSEKTPETPGASSGGKEIYGGCIVEEDRAIQDMPVNCLKSAVNSLTSSCSGEKLNSPGSTIKDVDDSQTYERKGSLSACHLYTLSRSRYADDSMRKVKLGQKRFRKSTFSSETNSLQVILTKSTGRVETRSLSRLKKRQKNDKTSAVISGVTGLATDKMSECEIAVGSAKGKLKKTTQTPNREKDLRNVESECKMQKKNKAMSSLSSPAAPDGEKQAGSADNHTLSEHVKAPKMNAKRQLVYETPERRKEYMSVDSPQTLSSKRSRSGRLLMPRLEYWRNQTAVYTADRTITGIEEGIHHRQPSKGSKSTPRRRRGDGESNRVKV